MSTVRIVRLETLTADGLELLNEYYEAVGVVVRDTPASIQRILDDPASGIWLAYRDDAPLGCVVLRQLPAIPHACECKRLYVRPAGRGLRIASQLMDALERFAAANGFTSVYLDTKDDLTAAIELYRNRGYQPCERYNDNPQATYFFRKPLP
jgi:ribosomal protein S18 acetylase RimI-like enzyme